MALLTGRTTYRIAHLVAGPFYVNEERSVHGFAVDKMFSVFGTAPSLSGPRSFQRSGSRRTFFSQTL